MTTPADQPQPKDNIAKLVENLSPKLTYLNLKEQIYSGSLTNEQFMWLTIGRERYRRDINNYFAGVPYGD